MIDRAKSYGVSGFILYSSNVKEAKKALTLCQEPFCDSAFVTVGLGPKFIDDICIDGKLNSQITTKYFDQIEQIVEED